MGWSKGGTVERPGTYTITLLGDPGGGKTSIKKRLIGKSFDSNEKLTVGADFTFFQMEEEFRLKICDIAGQASFATVRKNYLARSDAGLVIFDLTNPKSLDSLEGWLKEYITANRQHSPPVLLIGNKSDLVDQRRVTISQVKKFLELAEQSPKLKGRIIGYMETSAKTGENIKTCFSTISDYLSENVVDHLEM